MLLIFVEQNKRGFHPAQRFGFSGYADEVRRQVAVVEPGIPFYGHPPVFQICCFNG